MSARNIPREYEVFYSVTFSLADRRREAHRRRVARGHAQLHVRRDAGARKGGGGGGPAPRARRGSRAPCRAPHRSARHGRAVACRTAEPAPRRAGRSRAADDRDAARRRCRSAALDARERRSPLRREPDGAQAHRAECAPRSTIPRLVLGRLGSGARSRNRAHARPDTPAHSAAARALPTTSCMDAPRRARLATDAGGSDDEECAVCYCRSCSPMSCRLRPRALSRATWTRGATASARARRARGSTATRVSHAIGCAAAGCSTRPTGRLFSARRSVGPFAGTARLERQRPRDLREPLARYGSPSMPTPGSDR